MKYRVYFELDRNSTAFSYQVLGCDGDSCLTEKDIGEDLMNVGISLMDGWADGKAEEQEVEQ